MTTASPAGELEFALRTSDLHKEFGVWGRPRKGRAGATRALNGLNLEVQTGEIHGFLGPNGAGKTTTIRIVLGILRATSGAVELLDGDPWRDAVRLHRRVAYVPGDVVLWPNLTGGETIDLLGRLRGTPADRARRDELVERFALDPGKRARTYSHGNRQKVALIAALASDAEFLLLDEPSTGLDPLMEAEFRACLREIRAEGRTILLSSHVLAEVEAVCDRVTIIREGRTVEAGSLSQLRHLTRIAVSAETRSPAEGVAEMPGVHDVQLDGGRRLRCQVDAEALDALLRKLSEVGVESLESRPPTLEELFLRHYEARP